MSNTSDEINEIVQCTVIGSTLADKAYPVPPRLSKAKLYALGLYLTVKLNSNCQENTGELISKVLKAAYYLKG